jgi:hypothetical protein
MAIVNLPTTDAPLSLATRRESHIAIEFHQVLAERPEPVKGLAIHATTAFRWAVSLPHQAPHWRW